MPANFYRQITDRIIEQIEKGTPPWRQPWSDQASAIPHNVISKRPYKGINILLLWDASTEHGYSTRWATYRQWKALGNQVRRGERGTRIYHWKDNDQHAVVREHTVFAAEQCNDEFGHQVMPPKQSRTFVDYEPAELAIAAVTPADIDHGGSKAYYSVENDIIVLPLRHSFEQSSAYYSTALHELCHWSGHPKRLNRFSKTALFGSPAYAVEELVGEIGSAFLSARLGIPNETVETQSASYLASWLGGFKAGSHSIIGAASQASRAADYILSFSENGEGSKKVRERQTLV